MLKDQLTKKEAEIARFQQQNVAVIGEANSSNNNNATLASNSGKSNNNESEKDSWERLLKEANILNCLN